MLDELMEALRTIAALEGGRARWEALVAWRARWPEGDEAAQAALDEAMEELLESWRAALEGVETLGPVGVWRMAAVEAHRGEYFVDTEAPQAPADDRAWFELLAEEGASVTDPSEAWFGPLDHFLIIEADGSFGEVTFFDAPRVADVVYWYGEDDEGQYGLFEAEVAELEHWDGAPALDEVDALGAEPLAWPGYATARVGVMRAGHDQARGLWQSAGGAVVDAPEGDHFLTIDRGVSAASVELFDRVRWRGALLGRLIIHRGEDASLDLYELGYERLVAFA